MLRTGALALVLAFLLSGCSRTTLKSVLPRHASFPDARYSEPALARCLLAKHVIGVGQDPLVDAREGLANGQAHSVPTGLTGVMRVDGAGVALTPIGKGMASAGFPTPVPGRDGPAMNSATLVFFRNEALARRGAERAVEVYVFRANLSDEDKSVFTRLYGAPPPLSAIPGIVEFAGNVLVIWHYPATHVALSNRIVGQCLAKSES